MNALNQFNYLLMSMFKKLNLHLFYHKVAMTQSVIMFSSLSITPTLCYLNCVFSPTNTCHCGHPAPLLATAN